MSKRPSVEQMFPGGLPEGAKSLAMAMPGEATAAPAAPEARPAGVIVEFIVDARPVPWKPPTVTRNGTFKAPKLVAWQRRVSQEACVAMMSAGGPHRGPVGLCLDFYLTRKAGPTPDLTNLVKATEDALQGHVFVNDTQVRAHDTRRIASDRDGALIRVVALEEDA